MCFFNHNLKEIRRYFTTPTPNVKRVFGISDGTMMKILHGFTTHILKCEKCGHEESYETIGHNEEHAQNSLGSS